MHMRTAANDGRDDRGNLRKMLCPVSGSDFKSLSAQRRLGKCVCGLSSSQGLRFPQMAPSGCLRDDRNPSALGSQADILAGENFFQPAAANVGAPPRSKRRGSPLFSTAPPPLVVFAEKLFGERRSRASISDNWPTSTRVLVSYPRIRFRGEADINWQVRPADSVANDPKRSSLTFVVPAYMMCSSVRAMIFARCDGERSTNCRALRGLFFAVGSSA